MHRSRNRLANTVRNVICGSVDWREKLRAVLARQERDMTVVARLAGIPYVTMNRWVSKAKVKGCPNVIRGLALARALGVTMDQLFDPDVELPSSPVWPALQGDDARRILSEVIARAGGQTSPRKRGP